MAAVVLRARTQLRQRAGAVVVLAVMAGLAAGAVLALAAGGRRTDSVYPRFLRSQRAYDVAMASNEFPELLDRARRLPQVADAVTLSDAEVEEVIGAPDVDGEAPVDVNFSTDPGFTTRMNRLHLLEGRPPDPDRVDEVALGFTAADLLHLGPGDRLGVRFAGARDGPGPTVTFHVVGVEAAPGEFPPQLSLGGSAFATPAFARRYGGQIARDPGLFLRLRHGEDDIPAFNDGLQRLSGGREAAFVLFQRDNEANVQRSFHLQAVALWVVAALFAVIATVVVGQALRRWAALEEADDRTLRALGFGSGQLRAVTLLRAMPVALGAVVVAVVVAVLASPVFPLGLPRKAETATGVRLDSGVLAAGVVVTAMLVLLVAGVPPLWRAPAASASARRRLPGLTGAGWGGPGRALGVRLAFTPGAGRTAVPVRSTLVATVVAVAAVAGALTFGSSLSHLLDTPRLYGWNWDATTAGSISDLHEKVLPALTRDDRVQDVSLVATGVSLTLRDVRADLLLVAPVKGDLEPVVLEGRAPRGHGEVLVGSVTLRKLGARVGDVVPAVVTGLSPESRPLRIVGRGVLPSTSEVGRLGEGALLLPEGLAPLLPAALSGPAEDTFDSAAIRFAPGADTAAVRHQLRRLGDVELGGPEKPSDLLNFGRIEGLPTLLAGLLAVLGAAVLAHLLVTSVRRRRVDLAVFRALGLASRQVGAVVAWQATAVAVVTAVAGVPLGVAAGTWAWRAFATQLGVLPRPDIPVVAVLLLVPAAVLVANVAAALPARAAARVRPGAVLRTE